MSDSKLVSTLVGVVVKHGNDKTITVQVVRTKQHPLYKKVIRPRSKFHVHDEANQAVTGQTVRIKQCRPHSKSKTWELVEIL